MSAVRRAAPLALATALLTLLVVALAPRAAHAQATPPADDVFAGTTAPVAGLVAVTAEVNGGLTALRCHGDVPRGALADAASQAGAHAPAAVIDAGNLLGATAVSHRAVEHDVEALAAAVAAGGWRALAVGHRDLAARRDTLVRASAAFARRGVRYVFSNLRCTAAGRAVCDAVVDAADAPLMLELDGERVAVVSAIAPSWLDNIARDRAAGLSFDDPRDALVAAARRARAAGAARVIGVYDPAWSSPLTDSLALGASLPRGALDVLVVNGAGGRLRSAVSGGEAALPVVAARGGTVVLLPREGVAQVAARERRAPVPLALTAYEVATTAWLCREQSREVRGGPPAILTADAMATLLLDVLRELGRAEVAVINRGAVHAPEGAAESPVLTRVALATALPFDNFVRVGRVRGSVLAALARSDRAENFYLRGITREGDSVKINGRSVDDDLEYAVVTTDYVAEGGDGGLGGDATTVRLAPFGTLSARELLLRWLERPAPGATVPEARLRTPIDPARRTRWRLRLSLDAALQWVTVMNPAPNVFNETQLVRAQAFSLRGEGEVRFDGDHPDYTVENTLRLRYGAAQIVPVSPPPAPDAPPPMLSETADLITGRTTAAWRTGRGGRAPAWYEPLPYLDAYLESEFTRAPAPRPYHHLELRPSIGTRFAFNDRFYMYFGAGFSWEMLAREVDLTPRMPPFVPTVVAGWALRPGRLFSLGAGRDVEAESNLDVLFRHPAGLFVRGRVKFSVPLIQPVALTLTYDVFYRYIGAGSDAMGNPTPGGGAFAGDLSVGLKITFARAFQAFVF